MNRIARRDDLSAFNGAIPAPEIADESACFAHQKDTGGDIPKLQVAFPKAVETPCRDPGQIERGRSEAADARYFGRDRVQNALEPGHVAMAHEGNAGGDQGIGERSEEHTSELQSLMRTSNAVCCLKQNTRHHC